MKKIIDILYEGNIKGKYRFSLLFLIIVCVIVYFPILGNDFLDFWDDQWVVMNRYTEGGLNFHNLKAIFTEFYHGQYAPVNESIYLILYSMVGYNAFAFHLTSLLLHAANACLIFVCLQKILTLASGEKAGEKVGLIAFATALVFAVHPMNVESVAWVSAMKAPDYTLFYLLATYTFLRFMEKGKIKYYVYSVLLFLLSFGGKEQAVTFPVWLLLLYVLAGYSLKDRKVWRNVAPFLVLSVALGIVTMLSQAATRSGVLSSEAAYPLWQRLVLGCYSLTEYAAKFFLPYHLLYLYPFPMRVGEAMPAWLLVYPALLLTVTAALWKHLSKGVVAAGLTFFLIHIALMLHVVPLSRFVVIADRYIYLAGAGLAFIAAYYLVTFLSSGRHTVRNVTIVSGLLIALCLGICSNRRCRDWKNTDSIKKEIRELLKQREAVSMPVMKSSNLKRKEFMDACPVQGVRQGTGQAKEKEEIQRKTATVIMMMDFCPEG